MTSIDKQILAKRILHETVIPALDKVGLGGLADQELVLGTGIQESGLIFRRQHGNGPARGLWQMEPRTFYDLWNSFVGRDRMLHDALEAIAGSMHPTPDMLASNDQFAAAMCRVLYRRMPTPLPDAGDIKAQARYWKKYYNTPLGAGKEFEYVRNWNMYVTTDTWTPWGEAK